MRWAIVVVCCALPSGIAQAQNAPPALPDTSIWRPIIEYAIKSLAPYVTRVATDTASRAWLREYQRTLESTTAPVGVPPAPAYLPAVNAIWAGVRKYTSISAPALGSMRCPGKCPLAS